MERYFRLQLRGSKTFFRKSCLQSQDFLGKLQDTLEILKRFVQRGCPPLGYYMQKKGHHAKTVFKYVAALVPYKEVPGSRKMRKRKAQITFKL